jgi:hypothetical protein
MSQLNQYMSSCKHEEGILEFLKYFNGSLASISQGFATLKNCSILVWTKIKLALGITCIIELLYTEFHKNLIIREFSPVRNLIK